MENRVIFFFGSELKLQNLFLDFFIFLTQNFIQKRNNFCLNFDFYREVGELIYRTDHNYN